MKRHALPTTEQLASCGDLDEVTPKVEFATDSKARYVELGSYNLDMRRGLSDSAADGPVAGKSTEQVVASLPNGSLDFYPKDKLPIKRQPNESHEKRGESVHCELRKSRTPVKRGFFDEVAVSAISVGNSRQQKRSLVNLQNAVGVLTSNSNF